MKTKKRTIVVLAIALLFCLTSMIGTALMQNNWGKTEVTVFTGSLTELAGKIRDNIAANGKDMDITFVENADYNFSFMLLKPSNATAANPAPAVICSHGGANSKEMQMPNYVELARRGFVVISMDMAGHGRSDNAINGFTHDSYGMEAAAEYAMSLDFVDSSKIGVTGHSMGNTACYGTLMALNTEGSKNHIAAWMEGAGTMPVIEMTSEKTEGLIWGISCDKVDEFDTVYFGAYTFMTGDLAKGAIKMVYPEFNEDAVPEGDWFTPDGKVGKIQEGTALGVDRAIMIVNPSITHPAFHFSLTGAQIEIKFFYDAFGVPAGANYIPSTNQVWWITVCFELLGLIGFFMLLFPLVTLLLKLPLFAKVAKPERIPATLPSIKSWKEWVPLTVTLVGLVLFAFFSYDKCYAYGSLAFDTSIYPADVPNGVGYWTLIAGVFAIFMICVNYGLKRLIYGKEGKTLANPFASAGLDSISHFFRITLFAFATVAIMYIPVYIAFHVFNADFRICSLVVALPEFTELPVILVKYLPIWVLFYVPNAILNANTRFSDMPEWVSTMISSIANSLGLIVFIAIQYSVLLSQGHPWKPALSMGGIVAFAIVPCLAFAAISARFIYKKTGSAWAAGLINAVIMCLVACTLAYHTSDIMFPF